MVLYRKYRPQRFADLIGQKEIAGNLLTQLEVGKISHAYLFCGPKGTGKTSTARILAKALNCELYKKKTAGKRAQTFGEPCGKCLSCLATVDGSHLDLIEIDAASNRSIDDIREIREKVKLSPVFSKFKVYIIDEAHMLTKEAFNAFLKTLEEPPAHVIFILCTTEPEKLLATILSRVQRFNFKRATDGELLEVCEKIAKMEGIKIGKEAALAIVSAADGSFRDALSILDQLSSNSKTIDEKDILALSMVSGWGKLYSFIEKFADKDINGICRTLQDIWNLGGDLSSLGKETTLFAEKLLFLKIGIFEAEWGFSEEQLGKMKDLAERFSFSDLQNLLKQFVVAESEIKIYPLPHIPFVLAAFKYCGDAVQTKLAEDDDIPAEEQEAPKSIDEKPKDLAGKLPAKNGKNSRKSNVSLSIVEEKWSEILKEAKGNNIHVSAILRSTRPLSFEGDILTLEVFYRFHKEKLEEPKIISMLEKIISEKVGARTILKFTLALKESKPTRSVSASDVSDVSSEDLESLAAEIFSK